MQETLINRRHVLAGGILAALGTLWTPGKALADDPPLDGVTATFDIACLGHTLALDTAASLNLAGEDFRGAGFLVEGNLYSSGTIPAGAGFDPASVPAVGHWLCRGYMMFYPGRPSPHAITVQEFLFGRISEQQPVPADQIVSSGMEGGPPWVLRSVIGGTGRYRGARGEVIQQTIGSNKTVLNVFKEPAPTWRFHFKI
jgi:hypothetical protein